jgi:hypothetical protein
MDGQLMGGLHCNVQSISLLMYCCAGKLWSEPNQRSLPFVFARLETHTYGWAVTGC